MLGKSQKSLVKKLFKCVDLLITFLLYLTFVYWSTEAVLKYLDEPTITEIHYNYGDNENGSIQFPLVTLCSKKPHFVKIIQEECGVDIKLPCTMPDYLFWNIQCDDETNTPECKYDRGMCCGSYVNKGWKWHHDNDGATVNVQVFFNTLECWTYELFSTNLQGKFVHRHH